MKTLTAPATAALSGGSVAVVQLILLEFAQPVALNLSTWDLTWQRRVNLLTYSERFDLWSRSGGAIVAANAIIAPDGSLTADSVSNTPNQLSSVFPVGFLGYQVGTQYTRSVYAKAGTGTGLLVFEWKANPTVQTFNLLTGIPTGAGATMVDVGNGWYRCSGTVLFTGVGAGTAWYIGAYGTISTPTTIHLWGAQIEEGGLCSTYTPTTTTTLNDPGITYKGAYGLGTISAVTDKPGEVQGIVLELAAGDAARISLALDEADQVQGTRCTIRTAIVETENYTVVDAPIEWVGTLDTMAIAEDGQSANVRVTAESRAVDLLRGNVRYYSDADQVLINPLDRAFKYLVDQTDKPVVWPAKAFFYR